MLILTYADSSLPVLSIPIHISPVHTCPDVPESYVWQWFEGLSMSADIALTEREFRGKCGKPVLRVSQSDGSILTLLTAFVCQQSTTNHVGQCGREGLFQRVLKMSQPAGGELTRVGEGAVHPTGTSVSNWDIHI